MIAFVEMMKLLQEMLIVALAIPVCIFNIYRLMKTVRSNLFIRVGDVLCLIGSVALCIVLFCDSVIAPGSMTGFTLFPVTGSVAAAALCYYAGKELNKRMDDSE